MGYESHASDRRSADLRAALRGGGMTLLGFAVALVAACSGGDVRLAPDSNAGGASSAVDEIVLTGARRADEPFSSPSPIMTTPPGGVGAAQPPAPPAPGALQAIAGATPATAADAALRQRADAFRAGQQNQEYVRSAAAAARRGPPLSHTEPGEELWVIATADTEAPASGVEDDAPGSGTMLAFVSPDRVSPPQEIPLPLKHTEVHANVTGYIGTVDVTQQFENPYNEKIEAVYLFPLPEKAAVSEFVMTIGERKIRGILREKGEAEELYREARAQGYRASLLVQRRPNIFEQKVANIEPGKGIDVSIRYFHTLAYEDGWYSFVFPTVVGPRYNPVGSADPVAAVSRADVATAGTAVRYLRPNERSAHDLGIAVDIDAGVAIEELEATHAVRTRRDGDSTAHVELAAGTTIPNRDFVLKFRVAGDTLKSSLLTYTDPATRQGYFTLMIYPPAGLEDLERQPVEMVFVLDTSGSMMGRPLAQAVDAVRVALDHLAPSDSFQILNFSDKVSRLGAAPLPATRENLDKARLYLANLDAGGGTEMINGIRAALAFPADGQRTRFVTFLTDGYIGNEAEILAEVNRSIGTTRIFSFGVGNSVNRYLLDGLAVQGRGAVAYLGLDDSAADVMQFFFDRISHPALADLTIDWRGMSARDVYPQRLPDLFVGRPVVVTGRYSGTVDEIRVRGRAGQSDMAMRIAAGSASEHGAALRSLWARLRIEDLANRQIATADPRGELAGAIRNTALEFGLLSAYTAFIAVDASERTDGARGTTVHQGVPVPSGVRYDTTVIADR